MIRAVFVALLGVTGVTLAAGMFHHGLGLQVGLLVGAIGLALVIGYCEGVDRVMNSFESVPATCVGGPMDGVVLPAPPVEAAFVLVLEDHPEGTYRLDGDRLLWEEDRAE